MKTWSQLLKRIDVRGEPSPVSVSQLDLFETHNSLQLPASYREYCRVFGAGRIRGRFPVQVAVPGNENSQAAYDITRLNVSALQNHEFARDVDAYCSDPALFRSGLFFGSYDSFWFFWNRNETTDAGNQEMMVYLADPNLKIERLADSFGNFVFDTVLTSGIPAVANSDDSDEFWPAKKD